ncbi:MAG TPA: YceI family protein [Streptosporangiaceae bacterium]|jgi:polyisoprenoid-binding protein YceI
MTAANNDGAGEAAAAGVNQASWQLDPTQSSVRIKHKTIWGLQTVRGSFGQVSGSGEILPDGSGRGRLEIGAASLETKNRQRDKHLRSADFFHAAEHPHIVVDLSRITRQGDSAAAEGTLNVAGRTRPLAVNARVAENSDGTITLTADTEINRADFGMTWNQLGMIRGNAQVSVVARFVPSAS